MVITKAMKNRLEAIELILKPNCKPFIIFFDVDAPKREPKITNGGDGYKSYSEGRENSFAVISGVPGKSQGVTLERGEFETVEAFEKRVESFSL